MPRKMWKRMFIGKTDWQAVIPTYDLARHEFGWIPSIRGNECPCQWRIDWDNRIVIHGSYDNREKRENPFK